MPAGRNKTNISHLIDLDSNGYDDYGIDSAIKEEENERQKLHKSISNSKIKKGNIRESYMYNNGNENNFVFEKYEPQPQPQQSQPQLEQKVIEPISNSYFTPSQMLSCVDVCNHVNSCPVCSKIHNNDKTIYIILIILLSIITIICLKKILNV